MGQWRTLDLQKFSGTVAAKDGHVTIGDRSVALSDIATILTGPECILHASFIDRCAAFDVAILPCDWRGVPLTAITPWSTNTRVGARHIAQAELSEPRRKNAWMRIIKSKISGQAANLGTGSPGNLRLKVITDEVRSGDPANCEAQAARVYWEHLFASEDFVRDRNREDHRNSHLNYSYTILRGLVIRNIVAAGLWPTLGIWHRNRSNQFALADDIIEPFRPAADWLVMQIGHDVALTEPGIRQHLVGVGNVKFGGDGYTVSTELERLCQHFAQYVEGDIDKLRVPVWRIPAE